MVKGFGQNLPRFITGLAAVLLSLYVLLERGANLSILFASSFLLLICIIDTFYSRIPNILTFGLTAIGILLNYATSDLAGIAFSLSGLSVGLLLFLIPYLMQGMGAGDVKALAALGALLGPAAIFQVFLYTALFGGLLAGLHYALAHNLRKKFQAGISNLHGFFISRDLSFIKPNPQSESLRFPYASAIAFGFFSYLGWGNIL